jgi:hypothetical protein
MKASKVNVMFPRSMMLALPIAHPPLGGWMQKRHLPIGDA